MEYRQRIDDDDDEPRPWPRNPCDEPSESLKKSVRHQRQQFSEGQSVRFGHTVSRTEFIWRLEEFSWLYSALWQQRDHCTRSEIFWVGNYHFRLAYNPRGGLVCGNPAQCATLAVMTAEMFRILLRYRFYVKARGGNFVQWGETLDEVHHPEWAEWGDYQAYGPDAHWEDHPPESVGIFGLTHWQLLQSEWVENDVLTIKVARLLSGMFFFFFFYLFWCLGSYVMLLLSPTRLLNSLGCARSQAVWGAGGASELPGSGSSRADLEQGCPIFLGERHL